MKSININKYARQGQFLFLIGYCLKESSPLKLLGKMEPNLAGSIYVRSSKASSFGSIRPTNMATKINSFFQNHRLRLEIKGIEDKKN
jgi:ABC-type ATPase involved in cell division